MLRQRTPMARGKGFKRPELPKRKPAPLRPATRRATYTNAGAPALQLAKPRALRNRALLDLAKDMPCLLRVPGVCHGGVDTTVACHSNWGIHGKAKARKADDCWSVWGCVACHRWLDQGTAPGDQKLSVFMAAMQLQTQQWTLISTSSARPQRDRLAAQWALDHLLAYRIL